MNLCIVGNGELLKPLGHLINTMDTVIRLSNFQTLGYEHLVGTKTDIVAVSRIEELDPMPPIIWLANLCGFTETPVTIIEKYFPTKVIVPSSQQTKRIFSKFKTFPTLGSITIQLALEWGEAFYKQIFFTGFGFAHIGRPRAYFDQGIVTPDAYEQRLKSHDYDNERDILKSLVAAGKIEPLNPREMMLLDHGYGK